MKQNRFTRKQLSLVIELIKKPIFADGSKVYSRSSISSAMYSLRRIGFDIRLFRWSGRSAGRKSYGNKKGFRRFALWYMAHNKRMAYNMVMERIGDVQDHWVQIGKPILGDLVVNDLQGYKSIKGELK